MTPFNDSFAIVSSILSPKFFPMKLYKHGNTKYSYVNEQTVSWPVARRATCHSLLEIHIPELHDLH